ncbi:hypothetical protein vBCbaSRXM_153 [Citromicrobium phage vB_CbaS-RXM]|nr:hypothetical protein vBCbaSRXM_153 [Citromicrobium phage vB_CbaS-RXM]
MAMNDKYEGLVRPNLHKTGQDMFAISPNDNEELELVAKALRIYNDTDEMQTLTFITYSGRTVQIKVPPTALIYEDVMVRKVMDTGTGALSIHGYTD